MLLPLLALITLVVACGDDDAEDVPPTDSPSPSASAGWPHRSNQYMQLGEAKELLRGLGLEGVSLSAANYECIQRECPDEAPGDDSWGCLSLLPTGDPENVESHWPDDPPGWWSVTWTGALRETYRSPPEPVVNEPSDQVTEPVRDIACGEGVARQTTAADAAHLLAETGFEGVWRQQGSDAPADCPATSDCPIPGIPAETTGCLGLAVYEQPRQTVGQQEPSVEVYTNWGSGGNADSPDGVYLSFSTSRPLTDLEAAAGRIAGEECPPIVGSPQPPHDPYMAVPFTDVLKASYWRLLETPTGTALKVQIAVGNSCDSFERIDVEETETSVTMSTISRQSNSEGFCEDIQIVEEKTVELEAPLGNRVLLGCAPEEIWHIDHAVDCSEPGGI